MKAFGVLFVLVLTACQTVPTEKNQQQPEPAKKNPQAEPSLPPKPERLQVNIDNLDCSRVEAITMLNCLYPDNDVVPFPYCEKKDDYAILGLIPFAVCTGEADILISHLSYAKKHYRPTTIGLMQRVIKKMLSDKTRTFTRPLVYTKGLSGKDALILMTAIYYEAHITGDFNAPMKAIINEQAAKEPDCLFFQFMQDLTERKFSQSLVLAMESRSRCSYYKQWDVETIKIDIYYVQDLMRKAMR